MSYQLSTVYNKFVISKLSEATISDVSQFWTSIETSEKGKMKINFSVVEINILSL